MHASADTSIRRTVILHVVALAGLACGAMTGVYVAREAAAAIHSSRPEAMATPASLDGDGEPGGTCMLPGMRKPGTRGCDV